MLQTIHDILFNEKVFKACSILDATKGELKNQFAHCSNQTKTTNYVGRYFTEKFIVSEIIKKFPYVC
jgi:hypothetical protein